MQLSKHPKVPNPPATNLSANQQFIGKQPFEFYFFKYFNMLFFKLEYTMVNNV
jgi:hypothetical protein